VLVALGVCVSQGVPEVFSGQLLSRFRRQRDLTVAGLARKVNRSAVTVQQYESERLVPPRVIQTALAQALGVAVSDLQQEPEDQEPTAPGPPVRDAQAAMEDPELWERICQEVEKAPPLTASQRARLAALFIGIRPKPEGEERSA